MRKIFQTLKDENPENVEENGPFPCSRNNAWLHTGYYFWDQDIQLAHWWGSKGYKNSYIICESYFDYDLELCWDLHNEFEAREEFRLIVKGIKERDINNKKEIKVRDVIEELQRRGLFRYKAIRLAGLNSIGSKDSLFESYILDKSKGKYKKGQIIWTYDNRPAIQVCFYEKHALNRNIFKIVYPEHYVKDEVVF